MQDKIWSEFSQLPADAQRQVEDFIAFLRQRYERGTTKKPTSDDWSSDPFVGQWQDREEMQDSTEWVRHTRLREWGERGA